MMSLKRDNISIHPIFVILFVSMIKEKPGNHWERESTDITKIKRKDSSY